MGTLIKSTAELNTILANSDGNADTNYRIKDGVLQLKDVNDSKYYTIWIQGGTFMIADTGEV